MDNVKIGAFIREMRKEKNLTQKDIAKSLHITDRAVSKWERGLSAPDISLLEPLAETLGITVSELLKGEKSADTEIPKDDEVKAVIDYSKLIKERKAKKTRKHRLITTLCVFVALIIAGALVWRSGILFRIDKVKSPDGQKAVDVYSKEFDFGFLRFTPKDDIQTILTINDDTKNIEYRDKDDAPWWVLDKYKDIRSYNLTRNIRKLYVSYGNDKSSYNGIWWSPDSKKYVISFRRIKDDETAIMIDDVETSGVCDVTVGTENLYDTMVKQGIAEERDFAPEIEYEFLKWGDDSESILLYYSYTADGKFHEGTFWFNNRKWEITNISEFVKTDTEYPF